MDTLEDKIELAFFTNLSSVNRIHSCIALERKRLDYFALRHDCVHFASGSGTDVPITPR